MTDTSVHKAYGQVKKNDTVQDIVEGAILLFRVDHPLGRIRVQLNPKDIEAFTLDERKFPNVEIAKGTNPSRSPWLQASLDGVGE